MGKEDRMNQSALAERRLEHQEKKVLWAAGGGSTTSGGENARKKLIRIFHNRTGGRYSLK